MQKKQLKKIILSLLDKVIEAFNTGDVSNVSQFISPQYLNHESQMDPVRSKLRGPEEFIDTIRNNRIAFPDLRHEEQAIITQGDMVVSIINVTGTNTGNFSFYHIPLNRYSSRSCQ